MEEYRIWEFSRKKSVLKGTDENELFQAVISHFNFKQNWSRYGEEKARRTRPIRQKSITFLCKRAYTYIYIYFIYTGHYDLVSQFHLSLSTTTRERIVRQTKGTGHKQRMEYEFATV